MLASNQNTLLIISGPSCVGKTPLLRALYRFYPALMASYERLVLYTSRPPRPAEQEGVDYFFRSRQDLTRFSRKRCMLVRSVRKDIQACDIQALIELLKRRNVLYEGNPYLATGLLGDRRLKNNRIQSLFLAPLSSQEITALRNCHGTRSTPHLVTEIMQRKILHRAELMYGTLASRHIENAAARARCAYRELRMACQFQQVIVNHDGEDSENWEAFGLPLGDARRTLEQVVQMLQGKTPAAAEIWPRGFP